MNEEVEKLKERIYSFLDKNNITEESQYFLLLSMTEELKDTILDTDNEEPELDEEEDADSEEDEDIINVEPEPVKAESQPENPIPPPKPSLKPEVQKPTSNHNIRMKELLKKKNVSNN